MYGVKRVEHPKTLDQALILLRDNPEIVPYAGGTDILVKMRAEKRRDVHLMALHEIKELCFVKELKGGINIGPMVTFSKLAREPLIEQKLTLLKTAALSMGGPQIQNVATIGGNVCNGATSADGAAPLMALDAKLALRSYKKERIVPIAEFFVGPGEVILEAEELLVNIFIPPTPTKGFACVYKKFATRKAMDLAILGCAATVSLDLDESIRKVTLAYCTAGPTPVRCLKAEERLVGESELSEDLLEEVADLATECTSPRTSWRASKEYRLNLIRQLAKRTIAECYIEARERL